MPMGKKCLYCCQFVELIRVPGGMACGESASTSESYACGSKVHGSAPELVRLKSRQASTAPTAAVRIRIWKRDVPRNGALLGSERAEQGGAIRVETLIGLMLLAMAFARHVPDGARQEATIAGVVFKNQGWRALGR